MKIRLRLTDYRAGSITSPLPILTIQVIDRYGTRYAQKLRIDTGADLAALPIDIAERQGIAFSRANPLPVYGLIGSSTVYRDKLKVVIGGREHEWPCNFMQTPRPALHPLLNMPVLGRAGFLDEYACDIDDGFFIVTRLGPVRRFIRRQLHRCWQIMSLIHSSDRPA